MSEIESNSVVPSLCKCQKGDYAFYKSKDGERVCTKCFYGEDYEMVKELHRHPMPDVIKKMFGKKHLGE